MFIKYKHKHMFIANTTKICSMTDMSNEILSEGSRLKLL